MYRLIFHPEALKEFNKSVLWYEDRQKNLGARFIKIVNLVIGRIQNNPEHFRISRDPYREAPVPVFPFTIVYKINKAKRAIYIASIFHTSRNPRLKFRKI